MGSFRTVPLLLCLWLTSSLLARTYQAEGLVISVDRENQLLTISHKPIAKYMGAMVMPFHTPNLMELDGLAPGNQVAFELVVLRDKSYIRSIRKISETNLPVPQPANRVPIGAKVPDFSLTDQEGRAFRLSDLQGKVVVLDFLYTRCPLPDVCPRLAANFAALQRRLANRGDLALVSITVDPEYDTPAVLKEYGTRWAAKDNWFFLTGPLTNIERVSGYFGLVSWAEEGTLSHTSSTAVISRDGKLVGIVEGSTYRLNQLLDLVQSELGGTR